MIGYQQYQTGQFGNFTSSFSNQVVFIQQNAGQITQGFTSSFSDRIVFAQQQVGQITQGFTSSFTGQAKRNIETQVDILNDRRNSSILIMS